MSDIYFEQLIIEIFLDKIVKRLKTTSTLSEDVIKKEMCKIHNDSRFEYYFNKAIKLGISRNLFQFEHSLI
jgi:hypothetical protein